MPLGDVLQMLQVVGSIDAQRKAQELAQKSQSQSAYGDFTKIISSIRDPGQRQQFIQSYAQSTGVDPNALSQIAQNTEPSIASTNAELQADYVKGLQNPDFASQMTPGYANYAHQVGAQVGTGQGVGDLAHQGATEAVFSHLLDKKGPFADALRKEFESRTAAGMSAGNAMVDTALSSLPNSQHSQMAQIGGGTALNAGQVQQGALESNAQNLQAGIAGSEANYRDRALAQQGVVGMASIDQRAQAAAARQNTLDAAKKRLIDNLKFITTSPTTISAGSMTAQMIQEDYDLLHGQGTFTRDFGQKPDFVPGFATKLSRKLGL